MKDKWLEDIRRELSDYEMDVPEGLWEKLAAETTSGADTPLKKHRAPFLTAGWRRKWSIAAACVLALSIFIGLYLSIYQQNNSILKPWNAIRSSQILAQGSIDDNKIKGNIEEGNISSLSPESVLTENNSYTSPVTLPAISSGDDSGNDNVSADDSPIEEHPQKAEEIGPTDPDRETDLPLPLIDRSSDQPSVYAYHRTAATIYPDIHDSSDNRRYAIGLTTSGMESATTSSSQMIINPDYLAWLDNQPSWDNTESNGPAEEIPPMPDEFINQKNDTHYLQPIRFGLTFQYNFNDRIGLESGLTYSRLSSENTLCDSRKFRFTKQTLQYVGVPINLKITALSWKSLDLYASAGLLMEKCISNKIKGAIHHEGTSESFNRSEYIKPWQWSLNAAAGLQFRIGNLFGIFAEPGVSYYFDNNSSVRTIYQSKPWEFNLNIGIRVIFGEN